MLPAVTVSLQALMPSFAAAQTLLTTLLAMWDSSETGAAGALVIVLQEAKLAMAAPYGFVAPGALLDAEAVFMWHAEAPSPAKKAATNATAAPVSPMRNITATVTFSGLTPTQWGVIGGGVRGKVNESAPLVIAFRTELAAKLALPALFVAGNITITGINLGMGGPTSIKAFMMIMIGGAGVISGAIAGGFILGMMESIGLTVLAVYGDITYLAIFASLMVFLAFRPQGLMGKPWG